MTSPFTMLDHDRATRVDAHIESERVLLSPDALEASLEKNREPRSNVANPRSLAGVKSKEIRTSFDKSSRSVMSLLHSTWPSSSRAR